MKTDDKYIYPSNTKELSYFYDWECEVSPSEEAMKQDVWDTYTVSHRLLSCFPLIIRIKLPTLDDLSIGDVLMDDCYSIINLDTESELEDCYSEGELGTEFKLLISRGIWVDVNSDIDEWGEK